MRNPQTIQAKVSTVACLMLVTLWSSSLQAQSSNAAASERLRQIEEALGGVDKKIDEDDVIEFLKARKNDPQLAQAIQESECDHKERVDCETWLEARAIRVLTPADRNNNHQLDPQELKDFETAVIWGKLVLRDLLPDSLRPASATDAPASDSALPSWLGTRVTVRRSFLDERGTSDPATIAWTHFGGGDETLKAGQERTRFDIQAAISAELGNELPLGGAWNFTPVLVVEGDVSTDETIGRDTVTHRLGAQIYGEMSIDSLFTAHFIDLTFDYRTDRDYRSEVLGATLQYTPNMPKIGVGLYVPAGRFFFRWRPYLGLTYGDVRDPGQIASLQQSDGFTNPFARLRLEMATGKQRFILAAEGQVVVEHEEDDEDHTAYGASLRYLLDREGHMSLIVSYEQGEKPPRFESKEQTKIALGIKF